MRCVETEFPPCPAVLQCRWNTGKPELVALALFMKHQDGKSNAQRAMQGLTVAANFQPGGGVPPHPTPRSAAEAPPFCSAGLSDSGPEGTSSTSRFAFTKRPADKPSRNPEDAPLALLKAKRAGV
jgi:hypothetical protein